ncbi:hypothetical protein Tco_0953407 [Tanacetum coccineum]|uniref:Uncharacterized protein n=1 Tax=Tanacetum coccineum TaxID=301880 RepID=A0ABQ5E0I4_9ASTR
MAPANICSAEWRVLESTKCTPLIVELSEAVHHFELGSAPRHRCKAFNRTPHEERRLGKAGNECIIQNVEALMDPFMVEGGIKVLCLNGIHRSRAKDPGVAEGTTERKLTKQFTTQHRGMIKFPAVMGNIQEANGILTLKESSYKSIPIEVRMVPNQKDQPTPMNKVKRKRSKWQSIC